MAESNVNRNGDYQESVLPSPALIIVPRRQFPSPRFVAGRRTGNSIAADTVFRVFVSRYSRHADVSSTMTQHDHLAQEHVLHGVRDSAGAKARLSLAGEGHPVGSEGGVIIHHYGRSGEMFSRV
jgi:hypothetical protein